VSVAAAGRRAGHKPCVPTVTSHAIASHYRYVPVLAMNDAEGMKTRLDYTYSASTGQQTSVTAATSADGIGWTQGGSVMEETDRDIYAPWSKSGIYHRYVWANYDFYEYKNTACSCTCSTTYTWNPHHFSGVLADNNPDKLKNGTTIGKVKYTVPPFTSCGGNCWFVLNNARSGWGRDSGTRHAYTLELSVAGFLSLSDWATYGSITAQHWWKTPGCPNTRIIWGDDLAPAQARIVQASCMPKPSR
jgi:hypothetical protein